MTMRVIIITTDNFRREAKKLLKKYNSLKGELKEFAASLEKEPTQGIKITEDTYKIRLSVKSKGKGKSGGLRVITHIYIRETQENNPTEVYLLSIYDKSDFESISDKFLKQLIADIQNQIKEESNSEAEGSKEDTRISEEE
jgi:mRNA-degrading endonuclease RelE of RelBE toxin-antitoxin system